MNFLRFLDQTPAPIRIADKVIQNQRNEQDNWYQEQFSQQLEHGILRGVALWVQSPSALFWRSSGEPMFRMLPKKFGIVEMNRADEPTGAIERRKYRVKGGATRLNIMPRRNSCYVAKKKGLFMPALAEKDCVPCKGEVPALKGADLSRLKHELKPEWQIVQEHHLEREFKFKNFVEALAFTNKVGELAEQQGHHPDIYLTWGKVKVTIWTHKIDGLTESDFVLAAKIDRLT
ncbi:MAG TPA: 4a-hydroxytetrahydrobiopterin dehydratase [Verrucomicrobiae bacterium]|nr:4a-hydroxytetrahydrobiopterin dehydratase [Verrucomicrobiae bacterium]